MMRRIDLAMAILLGVASTALADQPKDEKPKTEKPAAAAQALVEAAEATAKAAAAEQEVAKEVISGLIDGVLNLFGGGGAEVAMPVAVQVFADANDAAAGGDQFEQQFMPQIKPLMKAELSFIQRHFQPTKEQQKELKKVGDQALKKAVKQLADVQKKMQQGGWQMPQDGTSAYPDPSKPIQETFAATLKTMFPDEKLETYQVEMTKRAEARKRVALLNLMAKIDRELVLSKEQRAKITEEVSKNWKSGWEQSLQMFMNGDEYVPRPPDAAVIPFLSETQKKAWQEGNNNQNVFWGFGWFGGVMVEDEVLMER